MINLLFLALIVLLSYFIGIKLLTLLKFSFNSLSVRALLSITFGMGIIATVMFMFGVMGLYYKLIIISSLVIPLIVLVILFGKSEYLYLKRKIQLVEIRKKSLLCLLLAIFMCYVLFNLIRCMTPVLNGDSLYAYLQVPSLYVNNHSIYKIDWIQWSNAPLNIQMLSALGILLHSDILSQLLSGWLAGLLCALAIYVLARKFVNRKIALISAIIFYTMPTLSWLIHSTKVDLGYTLFELCFWILFVTWIMSKKWKHLLISAIFLGFAIGSKYHALIALFFAACTIFIIMVRNKEKFRGIILIIFLFSIIALSIGSPSYIKNYIYTNDPVYPFITNPSHSSEENINQYKGIVDYIRFQYNMIFGKDYLFTPRPMMDRPIGFLPVLFLPFIFFINKRSKFIQKLLFVLLGYYIFLSFIIYKSVFPYPRHFLPAIGLLTVINAIGLQNCYKYMSQRFIVMVLIVGVTGTILMSDMTLFSKSTRNRIHTQLSYILGSISKEDYLKEILFNSYRHMNYAMLEFVKTLDRDVRIMSLDYASGYYVERPILKENYIISVQDIDSLMTLLKNDKITHVYYSKPGMDYVINTFNDGLYSPLINRDNNNLIKLVCQYDDQYLYQLVYQ